MQRSRVIALTAVTVVAVAVGVWLLYDNVLRGDQVAPLALSSPGASAVAGQTAPAASPDPTVSADPPASDAPGATGTPAASSDPGSGSPVDGDVAGTWTVVEGSQAGYRVREQFANLPAETEAVGRTDDVSGSITVVAAGDGAQVTEGSLTVDTTTIASDEGRRDSRLRSEGLQTDQYPTATFTLTAPLDVPASALAGTATDVTMIGDLTLHGVTKNVQIPGQARLVDGQVQVQGALTFPLADFGITPPNVGGFILSIADEGTLEFLVVFARA